MYMYLHYSVNWTSPENIEKILSLFTHPLVLPLIQYMYYVRSSPHLILYTESDVGDSEDGLHHVHTA